jgi:glycosyltransferase involved in cell wall biosynthesis
MKIAFVLPGFAREPIGGVRVVYNFANGLAGLGHEVTVVHVALPRRSLHVRDGKLVRQVAELVGGGRDLRRGAPGRVSWQPIDPAIEMRYVSSISPRTVPDSDIVVATAWQTALPVARLPIAKGRGHYLIQGYETWSGSARRVHATWRLPLRKVFIAGWLEDKAKAMGLVDGVRVRPGIDLSQFRVVQPIDKRGPRVAMLYSESRSKGGADGVAALIAARREVPTLEATLFGVGPRPRGLPPWIEYYQDVAQDVLVEHVYNRASVYLCPSHAEGWHLPPAEAMACGAALVSTAIDGVADYAFDGATALLSPPNQPLDQSANLVRMLADDELRLALAARGHDHIRTFTWERSTCELEAIFSASTAAPLVTR